jgi:preprotein translocase subunit SecF
MFIITYRKLFLVIGLVIVLACGALITTFGLKAGIDFTGGSLTEVKYATMPDKATIESALAEQSLGGSAIRESSGELGTSYIITTKVLEMQAQKDLEAKLTSLGQGGSITRSTSVGPVIGEELKSKAYYAIGMVLFMIIVYVAFAFRGIGTPVSSWVYGSFTIVVLVHDILVPTALMSVTSLITKSTYSL